MLVCVFIVDQMSGCCYHSHHVVVVQWRAGLSVTGDIEEGHLKSVLLVHLLLLHYRSFLKGGTC